MQVDWIWILMFKIPLLFLCFMKLRPSSWLMDTCQWHTVGTRWLIDKLTDGPSSHLSPSSASTFRTLPLLSLADGYYITEKSKGFGKLHSASQVTSSDGGADARFLTRQILWKSCSRVKQHAEYSTKPASGIPILRTRFVYLPGFFFFSVRNANEASRLATCARTYLWHLNVSSLTQRLSLLSVPLTHLATANVKWGDCVLKALRTQSAAVYTHISGFPRIMRGLGGEKKKKITPQRAILFFGAEPEVTIVEWGLM